MSRGVDQNDAVILSSIFIQHSLTISRFCMFNIAGLMFIGAWVFQMEWIWYTYYLWLIFLVVWSSRQIFKNICGLYAVYFVQLFASCKVNQKTWSYEEKSIQFFWHILIFTFTYTYNQILKHKTHRKLIFHQISDWIMSNNFMTC